MKHLRLFGYAFAAALCAGQANAEELTGTLKNIKETGTITLGFRDSSIPFLVSGRQPEAGRLCDGYLLQDRRRRERRSSSSTSFEVKLNPVTSATRIPLMANGTIDLECGSTTNNVERAKQVLPLPIPIF